MNIKQVVALLSFVFGVASANAQAEWLLAKDQEAARSALALSLSLSKWTCKEDFIERIEGKKIPSSKQKSEVQFKETVLTDTGLHFYFNSTKSEPSVRVVQFKLNFDQSKRDVNDCLYTLANKKDVRKIACSLRKEVLKKVNDGTIEDSNINIVTKFVFDYGAYSSCERLN
jgi:hypothetical protein